MKNCVKKTFLYVLLTLSIIVVGVTNSFGEQWYLGEEQYFLIPIERNAENMMYYGMCEKAELDIPGNAYIFSVEQLKNNYSSFSPYAKELIASGLLKPVPEKNIYFFVVRTEEDKDFTVKYGKYTREVSASEALTGEELENARRYFVLAEYIQNFRRAQGKEPGWAVLQEKLKESDKKVREIFEEGGVDCPKIKMAPRRFSIDNNFNSLFGRMSGTRAIHLNLSLNRGVDHALTYTDDDLRTVDIGELEGITVAEIDWEPLVENLSPALDPHAKYVPFDQHFAVFPSVQAAQAVLAAVTESGLSALSNPVRDGVTAPNADLKVVKRYLAQLELTQEIMEGLANSGKVKSVAITGSDTYFEDGTDIAILFETDSPDAIIELLRATNSGDATPKRLVEKIDAETVILTNSRYQLDQVRKTTKKEIPSLADLDEFRYFRDRYKIGEPDETVFVFLSDATIRRWCSPCWRIGQSRRIEQQEILATLTIENIQELISMQPGAEKAISIFDSEDQVPESPIKRDPQLLAETKYILTPNGAISKTYGSYNSLTPISELQIKKVSPAEKAAYKSWKDGYERMWRGFFDPIGIRLTLKDDTVKTDVSVIPLSIAAQDQITSIFDVDKDSVALPSEVRYDVPSQWIVRINPKNDRIRSMFKDGNVSMSDWVGNYLTVYLDADQYWDTLFNMINKDDNDMFISYPPLKLSPNDDILPLVVECGTNGTKNLDVDACSMYLLWMFGGRTTTSQEEYRGINYYNIKAVSAKNNSYTINNLYICTEYNRVVVTPNLKALKRAIDRKLDANTKLEENQINTMTSADAKPEDLPTKWLGESICVKLDEQFIPFANLFFMNSVKQSIENATSRNDEIIGYYQEHFPNNDPIELHERLFGERLFRHGEIQLDSPFKGIKNAELGVTLENNTLRARADVRFEAPDKK
ncbi:MAG: hypothetical protein ACRC2T_18660 [Thermoguttaceae bacterium]